MKSLTSLLTVDETCDELRISRSAVYGLFRTGQLRTVTIGRSRRVPRDAIESYLQTLSEQADA